MAAKWGLTLAVATAVACGKQKTPQTSNDLSMKTPNDLSSSDSAASPPNADSDFAARCAAAGVIACVGFDNTTKDIVQNVNVFPDGNGAFQASLDTAQKASGAGSLRFDLPPPPHATKNISGSWQPTDAFFGRVFSQGSTFYVQYRMRLSPEMIVDSWQGATWKTSIFHYNSSTCAAIELTTSNYYGHPLAQLDTDCGDTLMTTTLDGSMYTNVPPFLFQQGDFTMCSYANFSADPSGPGCLLYPSNEWIAIYYQIQIGTWDQPNSVIDVSMAREGSGHYQHFIHVPDMNLSCNGTDCTISPDKDAGYNNVTLTPYMTALTSADVGPSTTAHMWFDELIVSTAPIAAPNATP